MIADYGPFCAYAGLSVICKAFASSSREIPSEYSSSDCRRFLLYLNFSDYNPRSHRCLLPPLLDLMLLLHRFAEVFQRGR